MDKSREDLPAGKAARTVPRKTDRVGAVARSRPDSPGDPSILIQEDPVAGNLNPATGAPMDPVPWSTPREIYRAVHLAREASVTWSGYSFQRRAGIIRDLSRDLVANREELLRIAARESGRTETGILATELANLPAFTGECIRLCRQSLRRRRIAASGIDRPGKHWQVVPEPRGVIGVVSSWKQPVSGFYRDVFMALLLGNAVVYKPSEYVPRTGRWLAEFCRARLPVNLLGVFFGSAEATRALFPGGVNGLMFSGNAGTDRMIRSLAVARGVPVRSRVYGSDTALVCADAPLERAVAALSWYGFAGAGQTGHSLGRIYVENEVADNLVQGLAARADRLNTAGPSGGMAPEREAARILVLQERLEEACAAGAVLRAGGSRQGKGFGFNATVLDHCREGMALMDLDTPGPVVMVVRVDSIAELIRERRQGHGRPWPRMSLWTRDRRRGIRLLRQCRAPAMTLNNHGLSDVPAALSSPDPGEGAPAGAGDGLLRHQVLVTDNSRDPDPWWFPLNRSLRDAMNTLLSWHTGRPAALLSLPFLFRRRRKVLREYGRSARPF